MSTPAGPRIGVAVLVVNDDGRLLLGRRGKEPNYGKWIIPGGGVEFGEKLTETGMREIREETGLSVAINWQQRNYIVEVIGEEEHRIILCLEAHLVSGILKSSSDLLEAAFFERDAIPGIDLSPVASTMLYAMGWL